MKGVESTVGTVVSDVAGITCTTSCSTTSHGYNKRSIITLTATPAAGYRFGYWDGSCTGTSTTCEVTLGDLNEVEAVFVPIAELESSVTGTGQGAIAASVGGTADDDLACALPCGSRKNKVLDADAEVTLTATPASSGTKSRFAGWKTDGGATFPGCSDTGPCTVALSESKSIVAKFVAIVPLTTAIVSLRGGQGSVVSSQNWALENVDCGHGVASPKCNNDYDLDELVTITATPASGSFFVGWQDITPVGMTYPPLRNLFGFVYAPYLVSWALEPVAAAGCTTDPTCTVTMSQALTMEATFDTEPAATPTPTPPPSAPECTTFSASGLEGEVPHTVNFYGPAASETIDSWAWDFGDGETSTLQEPAHTFTSVGTFTVSLTVSGPGGSTTCTETRSVIVSEPAPSPTPTPSDEATPTPSSEPTPTPSDEPTPTPSLDPTASPEASPTPEPSDPIEGPPSTSRESGVNGLTLALLQLAAIFALLGAGLRQQRSSRRGVARSSRR